MNYFKTYFTTWLAEFWLFALGALFVAVTVLLPKGIVGLVGQINDKIKLGEVKGSAHPPPRTIIQILFSYEGRIGRGTFSAVIIPFFIVGAGVFVVSMWLGGIIESTKSGVLQIIIVAVFGALTSLVVVMTSMLLAIFIKRFHDLDKAGKWGLRLFILAVVLGILANVFVGFGIVSLVILLYLALWPGTSGSNGYGPPPGKAEASTVAAPASPGGEP